MDDPQAIDVAVLRHEVQHHCAGQELAITPEADFHLPHREKRREAGWI